jgi:hypothetical protein
MEMNRELENENRDPEARKCASALNEVIRFRGITLMELAEKSGIDGILLQCWTDTSQDIREARAIDLMNLAEALNVDPYILVGKKDISEFTEKAQKEQIDKHSMDFLRQQLSRPIRG